MKRKKTARMVRKMVKVILTIIINQSTRFLINVLVNFSDEEDDDDA